MNNKVKGTTFEKTVCDWLRAAGYWVHFMSPDNRGAQPFDIIAVRKGRALAIDCKTSVRSRFTYSRLEDNQIYSFEHWIRCGNGEPYVIVEYNDNIHAIKYDDLMNEGYQELGAKTLSQARGLIL